jgi:hypothetical protein
MHALRCLSLLLPVLLGVAALTTAAGVAAPPAAAGMATGNVTDKYGNPLSGILVEALDSVNGALLATATTSAGAGDYSFELDPPSTGVYKIRVSDPSGVFTTIYLYDSPSFENAYLIGYS